MIILHYYLSIVSGTVPENPVVCIKTGNIYERKFIEKYLATHGTEPITNEAITMNDLLPIKGANQNNIARPRPVEASSVGGLLKLLSTEWDSLLLEQFELRQTLESTRQELSQALYQHDAACRVIARLIKERDQARTALTTAQSALAQRGAILASTSSSSSSSTTDHAMDTENSLSSSSPAVTIPEDILTNLKDKNKELMKGRKKRVIPSETKDTESIRKFTLSGIYSPHAPSVPGITALQVHPAANRSHHIITGGMDKTALIYDISTALSPSSVGNPVTTGSIIGRLTGHTKRISGVAFHPSREVAITCAYDSQIKVHVPTNPMMGEWGTALSLKVHQREAIGLAVHPINDYVLSGGREGSWGFTDINSGTIISLVTSNNNSSSSSSTLSSSSSASSSSDIQYNCLSLHPDGILLGLGTNKINTHIYDLRTCQIAATFSGHQQNVNALSFSENGYYLASGGDDGKVILSDLRNLQTICSFTPSSMNASNVTSVNFDSSGYYLATGTNHGIVQIFDTKKSVDSNNGQGIELVSLKKHTNEVTQVGWGALAHHLVSVSMDRNINVYQ